MSSTNRPDTMEVGIIAYLSDMEGRLNTKIDGATGVLGKRMEKVEDRAEKNKTAIVRVYTAGAVLVALGVVGAVGQWLMAGF